MSVQTLSGVLTESYVFDLGDTLVIEEGTRVDWAGPDTDPALLSLENGESSGHLEIEVAGGLYAGAFAVYVYHATDTPSVHITNSETGFIGGQRGITVHSDGADTQILNHGHIDATYGAMGGSGDQNHFANSGLLTGGTGFALGFAADLVQGQTAINTGLIQSDNAFLAYRVEGLAIENTGTIQSDGVAFRLTYATTSSVSNSGHVDAGYGVLTYDSTQIVVFNSGVMICDHFAFLGDVNATMAIHNTGDVHARVAVRGWSNSSFELHNSGQIFGDIDGGEDLPGFTNVADRVVNSGLIDGQIRLSSGDDVYRGLGDGVTTGRVDGGSGQDRISGAALEDQLYGGAGMDVLRGRQGEDTLRGGDEDDRIRGGRDADTLSGGVGNDLFLFGQASGVDLIEDFTVGADRIQIAGHAGGFETLEIADMGGDLVLMHAGGDIRLTGLAGTVLTDEDVVLI